MISTFKKIYRTSDQKIKIIILLVWLVLFKRYTSYKKILIILVLAWLVLLKRYT